MLLGIAEDEDNHIAYTYNADGLRVQQVVTEGGVSTTTRYVWGNHGLAAAVTGEQTVTVLYGDDGEALGFAVSEPSEGNGNILLHTVYTYVKNLQGDVVRILDAQGNTVVKYAYDPWGVPTIEGDKDLAAINPCSYRGYYYDEETGYYYLQSRYYDPEIGRFINADDSDSILGACTQPLENHLFAYCQNAPIIQKDPMGLGAIYFVGCGIQVEVALGRLSFGLEIVWYFSSRVGVGARNRLNPYFYVYGSFALCSSATNIIQQIIKNPSRLLSPKGLSCKFSFSVSVFAIFGYSTFRKPGDYLGEFVTTSIVAWHAKGYTAVGSTCFAIGAGWSSNLAGVDVTYSYYTYLSTVINGITKLFNYVFSRAKTV